MMQLSTKVRHSLPRANFDDRSVVSNKSFGSTVVDLERAIGGTATKDDQPVDGVGCGGTPAEFPNGHKHSGSLAHVVADARTLPMRWAYRNLSHHRAWEDRSPSLCHRPPSPLHDGLKGRLRRGEQHGDEEEHGRRVALKPLCLIKPIRSSNDAWLGRAQKVRRTWVMSAVALGVVAAFVGGLEVWRGGLTFYGGFILAAAFGLWYAHKHRMGIWRVVLKDGSEVRAFREPGSIKGPASPTKQASLPRKDTDVITRLPIGPLASDPKSTRKISDVSRHGGTCPSR